MSKHLKLFWRYVWESHLVWWATAYASLIGLYEIADELIPERVIDLDPLDNDTLQWIALAVLLLAPFQLFVKLHKELNQYRRIIRNEAFTSEMRLKFGDQSKIGPEPQFKMAMEKFEAFETEILNDDFTHSFEILYMKDIVLRLCAHMYGSTTGPYASLLDRVIRVTECISRREEELREKSADLELSQ